MASVMKFLGAALLLLLYSKGTYSCEPDEVSLGQYDTGDLYSSAPVYNVTFYNGCTDCDVVDLSLRCPGFKTLKPIDPFIFKPSGDSCIISRGLQIYTGVTINFTYAWESQYPFEIAHYHFECAPPPESEVKGAARIVRG
ncbi:TPD1 protein homolog 1-like [Eucalyptus grandis]|nr:TPD1 protein homolog 1-like [Eucalyptus grandis]